MAVEQSNSSFMALLVSVTVRVICSFLFYLFIYLFIYYLFIYLFILFIYFFFFVCALFRNWSYNVTTVSYPEHKHHLDYLKHCSTLMPLFIIAFQIEEGLVWVDKALKCVDERMSVLSARCHLYHGLGLTLMAYQTHRHTNSQAHRTKALESFLR